MTEEEIQFLDNDAHYQQETVEDLGEVTRLEKKYLNQLVDQNISASSGVAILWEVTFRAKHELEELKKKTMIISTLGEEVEFLEVEDEVKNKIIENREVEFLEVLEKKYLKVKEVEND